MADAVTGCKLKVASWEEFCDCAKLCPTVVRINTEGKTRISQIRTNFFGNKSTRTRTRGKWEQRKGLGLLRMNSLSRRSRHEIEHGVVTASVVYSMTRLRTVYPNRTLVRHSSRSKNFLRRRLVLLCDRNRPGLGRGRIRTRSKCKLAIRPGRFPRARAARATARRIGISVWRSDYWEIPVVVR